MKRRSFSRVSSTFPRLRSIGLLASIILVLAATGCPGTLDPRFAPETPGGTGGMAGGTGGATGTGGMGMPLPPCDAPTMVFVTTCGAAGCHDGATFSPNLASDQLANLVGAHAFSSGAPCKGQLLLNPAAPASSVLLTRMSGKTCGEQMPFGAAALPQSAIDCVTSWVTANAK